MEKINVLIVDDHALIREGYQLILKKYKNIIHVVGEASCGAEALDFLEKQAIDVILLDISMPDLDGADLTEIILKNFPLTKILILTMHREESYIMKMVSLGVHGYLLKDSTYTELIDAVKTVKEGKKYYSNDVSALMIHHFLNKKESKPKRDNLSLTSKELEVIRYVAEGLTSNEIAKNTSSSSRTVDAHRRSIMKKINVKNTVELVRFALTNNIIS